MPLDEPRAVVLVHPPQQCLPEFLAPWLSLGAELRLQRYLGTTRLIASSPEIRDISSLAGGARFHVPVGGHFLRPALTVAWPLDAPLRERSYRWVQLDLPFIF
ncbi:MAG: hypothetical protein FJ086_20705 [Deltaproteobacteria bacterium]|nr:hypothetical protein [Deltaproteobacteria bacterium]